MKRPTPILQGMLAAALCLALPLSSSANITNTASLAYQDAAANNLTATASSLPIVTPPVITSVTTAVADVGAAFGYQITASNGPTSYSATGLTGTGLSLNSLTGAISGTPTTAGLIAAALSATNAAGAGASTTLTITVRSAAKITLTKTASAATARPGDTILFTISYLNAGAGTASNLLLTDAIPPGSTYAALSLTGPGVYDSVTNTITWTIPTVNAGGTGSVTFKVTVN